MKTYKAIEEAIVDAVAAYNTQIKVKDFEAAREISISISNLAEAAVKGRC